MADIFGQENIARDYVNNYMNSVVIKWKVWVAHIGLQDKCQLVACRQRDQSSKAIIGKKLRKEICSRLAVW